MRSILSVTTAALKTKLTTLAAVKSAQPGIPDDEDVFLAEQIGRASAAIVTYLGIRSDASGNATLGRETLLETFREIEGLRGPLLLARRPVRSITSVTVDGVALLAGTFEFDANTGFLWRLENDERRDWCALKVAVAYVAGWYLPEDATPDLPRDIEDAAIAMVIAGRSLRSRDPMLKSESVVGVGAWDYQVAGLAGAGAMTSEVKEMLDRHRQGAPFA